MCLVGLFPFLLFVLWKNTRADTVWVSRGGWQGTALPTFVGLFNGDEGFPYSSVGKESACNAGDPGSIPGLGGCPGEGNGNPLQCSCLENLMDRGAWWATVHGVARVRHDLATKPPSVSVQSPAWSLSVPYLAPQPAQGSLDARWL